MELYSNKNREFTIEKGCPWYKAQQKYGPANVNWCEPTQCSVINEPANTWSNLGFLIVAIYLYKKCEHHYLKAFAIVVFVMGFFSGVYHASNNYLTQFFDFIGMILMTSFIIAFNMKRMPRFRQHSVYTWFWFYSFLNVMTLMMMDIADIPIQLLLMINAIPIFIMDISNGLREKTLKLYSSFAIANVILIIAQISAQLDLKRIYCEPSNLFLHGHVIWHLLCAVAMIFIAQHMKRIIEHLKLT